MVAGTTIEGWAEAIARWELIGSMDTMPDLSVDEIRMALAPRNVPDISLEGLEDKAAYNRFARAVERSASCTRETVATKRKGGAK